MATSNRKTVSKEEYEELQRKLNEINKENETLRSENETLKATPPGPQSLKTTSKQYKMILAMVKNTYSTNEELCDAWGVKISSYTGVLRAARTAMELTRQNS